MSCVETSPESPVCCDSAQLRLCQIICGMYDSLVGEGVLDSPHGRQPPELKESHLRNAKGAAKSNGLLPSGTS